MSKHILLLPLFTLLVSPCFAGDVEIERKLLEELIDIELTAVPLETAVYRILGGFSVPARIDWPEDLERDSGRISLPAVKAQPTGDVLRQVLRSKQLDYTVKDGNIRIIHARERICADRDSAGQSFAAKGLRVEMVIADKDRCASKARVLGKLYREGDRIDEETVIGLIQRSGVIFQYQGFLFELRTHNLIDNPAGEGEEITTPGKPSPEDTKAFKGLDMHVTGIYFDEEDPRKTFAMISGKDVSAGERLGDGVLVKTIKRTHVIVSFRGFEWNIFMGQ